MDDLYSLARRFTLLYQLRLESWLLITAGFLAFWTLMMRYFWYAPNEKSTNNKVLCRTRKRGRIGFEMNLFLVIGGMVIIVFVSVVRQRTPIHRINLFPLRVLYGLKVPKGYLKDMIMNMVLYVPFACGMVFCLGRGTGRFQSHPVVATVLICFVVSIAAEALQYFRCSGYTEVDDVLMNTIGGAIGTLPYLLYVRTIPDRIKRRNNNNFSKEYKEKS